MTAADVSKTESQVRSFQESTEEGRPISWTALAALLLGVSSPLVGVSLCFLLLPVGAVFLGAVALWQTHEVDPVPVGRPAAWVGLFLGLFVVSGVVVYHAALTTQEENQVDALFEQFLKYLRRGDLAKAHQLIRDPLFRSASPEQVSQEYDVDPALKQSLKEFKNDLVFSFLRTARKLELVRKMTFAELIEDKHKFLNRRYTFRVVTKSGKEKEVTVEVVFLRRLGTQGIGAWWIHRLNIPVEQLL